MRCFRKTLFLLTAVILFGALPALVKADTITFEADAPGLRPSGFQSVQSSLVTISDSLGEDILLDNFSPQSIGNGIALTSFATSAFVLDFSVNVSFLSLDFGNDDSCCMEAGATAVLEVFLNGTLVGTSQIPVNLNDLMDQTIVFSMDGVVFNRAVFRYQQSIGTPGATEIIDNINFTPASEPVPEPASILLLGTGVATFAIRVRARRRSRVRNVS
jgi:PEP-CTERM motif